MSGVDAVLRRERAVVAGGLAALTVLAWIHIWRGAGMGMSALEMTRLALFPHAPPDPMAGMRSMPGMAMPGAASWTTVAAMWWVMMIAMMTPSAAPLVLLYGRVLRHHGVGEARGALESRGERRSGGARGRSCAGGSGAAGGRPGPAYAPSAVLVLGYLLVWLAFSAIAATLQVVLERTGLVSSSLLSSRSAVLSAGVLLAAGLYQLSPLKHACLKQCRGPVEFLTRHWRPGVGGALAMGARHGAWCVGCGWMLMALLFVGGIMNLVWVALLALLVLVEKVAPRGPAVGRIAGGLLIAWGIATLVVG
ncbi:MAG TPA: DUF2182 domain-containing protein [Gammaproteobacteria bacterium]|nr:DUF2182 domain-containing protein [Gammaproteobacteria bacterium]